MSGMLLQMLFFMPGLRGNNTENIFGILAFMVMAACAGCHFVILLRLPALGEK